MNGNIGFIGCGKMAQAIIAGMIGSELIHPDQIFASASSETTLAYVAEKYGIKVSQDNKDVAEYAANYLFLAVKPNLHNDHSNNRKPLHSCMG